MILKDQLNRTIQIDKTPNKIVSLVPSLTELLCDLGLEDKIIGITNFCVHPKYIKGEKTTVGGTKNTNINTIKNLNLDIIIANKEENTKEIIALCEQVAPVHVSDIITIDDILQLIKKYGILFNCIEKSNQIHEELKLKFKEFKLFITNKPRRKTAYFVWRKPWMVAGKNTFINTILGINNFQNIFGELNRYPEVNLSKNHLDDNVEIVFLPTEPYPFKNKHICEIQKYFTHSKIIIIDGEMFSWYGTRLIKALDYFKEIHNKLTPNN